MSAQGWATCEMCGGSGSVEPPISGGDPDGRYASGPCPDCADGLVPSDAVVEAAAEAIHNKSPKCYESFGNEDDGCMCLVKAKLVLVAARRAERTEG